MDRVALAIAFLAGALWAKGTSAEWRRYLRFLGRRAMKGQPLSHELWEHAPRARFETRDWRRE